MSPLSALQSRFPRRLLRFASNCVRIDTRTLAVFRILLGLLIVADILLRSRNFTKFYTESGVVPQSLAEQYTRETAFSVYYFTAETTIIAALFLLTALVGIQLAIGYRTRLATVVAFLLVISLDNHNPLVLSFADTLFRLLLFWAIFLPLGERWSVDAVHRDQSARPSVASVATALILIQVVFVYVSNAFHKAFSDLWRSGEAATLVLGLDNTTFLLGEATRAFPRLLQAGGFIWVVMLSTAWLLFLLRGRLRTAFAFMFIGVHASFAITVRIGAFPYVSIAGVLLFLPAQFWDDLSRLIVRLGFQRQTFEQVSKRFVHTARLLPNPTSLADSGTVLDPERIRRLRSAVHAGTLSVILVSILLVIGVLLANVGSIAAADPIDRDDRIEETFQETPVVAQIEQVATSLRIDQPGWSIFAPQPRTTDRYYVFPARGADGTLYDVYNNRELTFERADDALQKQYGTYRERFYMNSIRRAGSTGDAPVHLAAWICDEYEQRGIELTQLNMYVVEENVTLETIDRPEDRDRDIRRLSMHSCGDHPTGVISSPDQ